LPSQETFVSTFIDKFFQHSLVVPRYVGDQKTLVGQIGDAFKQAECIVAHNVSEYYFTSATEYWEFPRDFPMVVPPFRTCVIECARPSRVWSKEKGESPLIRERLPKTWAVLFQSNKLSEVLGKNREKSYEVLGWRADELRDVLSRFLDGIESNSDGEKSYKFKIAIHDKSPFGRELKDHDTMDFHNLWFCSATLFTETPNGFVSDDHDFEKDSLIGPLGTYSYLVDKYGYVLGEPIFGIPSDPAWVHDLDPDWHKAMEHGQHVAKRLQANVSASLFFPAFLAVSFMHCKNVKMKTERPPEKLNHSRVKKGRRPMVTYRTLEIDPMKKVLRYEGKAETTGIPQALHITRGHFKDYRDSEKGLFGRYKGLWWWEQHMAGRSEAGTVVKDYVELAPGQDEDPLKEM
jgi:hypothetical protein